MLSLGVLFFSFIAIMVTRGAVGRGCKRDKGRLRSGGAQMESPGEQTGLGETEAGEEGAGGTWGKGMQEPPRVHDSLTWRGQGGWSPLQSADTKPGSPRGRDSRPGRRARGAGSLSARSAARCGPAPAPPPARAPPPSALRVPGSLALPGPFPAPCASPLCALRAHALGLRGRRARGRMWGRRDPAAPSHLPASSAPKSSVPRLTGVRFHGEVPGRWSETRQRNGDEGAVLPPRLPVVHILPLLQAPPHHPDLGR